ncbi:hypothetical protein HZY62_14020 [Maribacter polysiphoniae]|uniref:Uncharacterized protein n=1 Tax=Maribacter polysiphoniae TaxID=429344 RepID=A0ABR7W130_9FLAO|nr:hypothetical protein [Maribacter polysiphoniae]MBD1261717.1 hypothetical protein [Maribacter polysiphoniae]
MQCLCSDNTLQWKMGWKVNTSETPINPIPYLPGSFMNMDSHTLKGSGV